MKELYRLEVLCLKVIPYLLTLLHIIGWILIKFGINLAFLNAFASMSFLPLAFIWISSFVFKFCWKHRLPIYYITVMTIYNWITTICIIPFWLYNVAFWLFVIAGIIILLIGILNEISK